jgi:hypothetical protein
MSNMSYCRFQNTLQDLRDCNDHLWDDLSEDEETARQKLVKLCRQIVDDFETDEANENDD